VNTKNLYWSRSDSLPRSSSLCRAVDSSPGRNWQADPRNELRVEVPGCHRARNKLQAFVLRPVLAAGGGHRLHAAQQRLEPGRHRAGVTLMLLLMVVIAARLALGCRARGTFYHYLDDRLAGMGSPRRFKACRACCGRRSSSPSSGSHGVPSYRSSSFRAADGPRDARPAPRPAAARKRASAPRRRGVSVQ